MAIAFTIAENKPNKSKLFKNKWVLFPDKIRRYLNANEKDFSSNVAILLALDEYDDTLLYKDRIEQLMQFCAELQKSVEDYSIFSKCKPLGVKKADLQEFANELSALLQFALDNGEIILSVGD